MSGLLDGHLAAVTGGGSGIGEAIALGYAEQGAEIVILDSNAAAGDDTAKAIRDAGGKASSFEINITDRAACHAVAAKIAADVGQLTVLVNNAGINRRTHITGDKAAVEQDWDDIIDVNIKGMFNITHALLEPLRASKGRIVNIASIQSFLHVSWPNSAAYTTSKHGVLGLTRALAAELGADGVRVNAIGPGLIETPLNKPLREANPNMVASIMQHTPLGRAGQPHDMVGPAVFLASDLSAYVTGSILIADGGFRTL
ncbi:MAG: NAD(P)-dependent dehydrogenase (short-subunit alcohol dehydrogenase family) [Hyphomicrobiaceae bacterium]|jgi:NAD(P)-dependent dehydrogenase (short-subunit alcohol dehydrogenase family)